jgi:hypothetical protein
MRTLRVAGALLLGIGLVAVSSAVLFGQFGRQSNSAMYYARADSFDGAFQFCRVAYRGAANGDGGDWQVDFPRADQNLSIRLSELTRVPVSFDELNEPNHLVVRLNQPELFHCPFVMMTEVGNIYLDEKEAETLREYLLKGGFLWADDFWGEYAWDIWESQIRKVFPSSTHRIIDLPLDHPFFNQFLLVKQFPQIPSIGWTRRGTTSERADSETPHARAILNEQGRVMVLITHNTDFGDSWEREGDDPEYFERFSVPGYAFGMNVMIYALTH